MHSFLSISHCAKSPPIWSFSGPHFAVFGLNTEIYRVNLRIQSEFGKMQTRKTPNTDTFHAVSVCFTYVMKPYSPTMIIIAARISPANIYLFRVSNRNTKKKKRCKICSKSTIKTPERLHFTLFSSVSVLDFEQANVSWIST